MSAELKTPVIGLIENMSSFCCPQCGHEAQIFGHDGGRADAARLGLPFLGDLPLTLDVRLEGEAGTPIAASDAREAVPCVRLARRLIAYGMA